MNDVRFDWVDSANAEMERKEAEWEEYLDSCPKCASCGEPITEACFVDEDGNCYCYDCSKSSMVPDGTMAICPICGKSIEDDFAVFLNGKYYHEECVEDNTFDIDEQTGEIKNY